jgi:hypothetical protein
MKGKIFPESSNVYQDQAKILFNYYQQMAEKIVQEEERIEKEIATLEEDKLILDQELSKAVLWKWVLCILIIPYFIFLFKEKGIIKQIDALNDRIVEFQKLNSEIFRDYKVSKLGVAYVPIAEQIKYENKSFMIDHTGLVEESEVKLQLSKQNDLLIEKIADLEKLSAEAPLVESSNDIEEIDTEQYSRSMQQLNQHDYFGSLERSLRTISYCMDDLDVTSVSLPLVANNSSYVDFIKEYSTSEIPEGAPTIEVFDAQKYNDDIAKFQELNKLKDSLSRHSAQFEDVLKGLMVTMANSVQAISALKVASTNKIVFESNKVLYKILKSPYNHYSPALEASEIERIRNESFNYGDSVQDYVPFQLKESSRAKYNLLSDTWVAEDGSSTNFPFGIHQIHEEIVAPMVQNLMNETRIERLKIYNHIKDQKISYLNKWHQDTEDFYGRNRAESADLINLMRASLRDYVAAYNTMASLKKTEDSMSHSGGSLDSTVVTASSNEAEVFQAFEIQSKEFQDVQLQFENYMERLKEDIDNKAEKFEHIDYYDALLRDGNSRDTAIAASELHELDERRKPLISVNPLFAKNSEMLPVPSVEDIIYEHMSLNLPIIAKNALRDLDEDLITTPGITNEINSSNESNNNSKEWEISNGNMPSTTGNSTINVIEEKNKDIRENEPNSDEIAGELTEDEIEFIDDELENEDDVEMIDDDEEVINDSSIEDLEKLSDSELKNILDKLGFEPMENFNRAEAIEAIKEEQGNIEHEKENTKLDESTEINNPVLKDQKFLCPNCNTVNGPEYQFCINCGNPLHKS